jgi:hypothetical protein
VITSGMMTSNTCEWEPPRLTNMKNVMLFEVKEKLHHEPQLVLLEDMELVVEEVS